MSFLKKIHSPNHKYCVELHSDYCEVGMGSPLFGHITIHGAEYQPPDHLFGETVIFSPDSRFVALEKL